MICSFSRANWLLRQARPHWTRRAGFGNDAFGEGVSTARGYRSRSLFLALGQFCVLDELFFVGAGGDGADAFLGLTLGFLD
jgi:hypothetical protein